MNYKSAPKVELHLHLDCSLSYDVVKQIDPSVSYQDYVDSFVAPPKCTDLVDYINRAIKGYELMQTKEQLKLVTLDLFKQLRDDHAVYAEIRFAPLQHTLNGLSPYDVVNEVEKATQEGIELYGIPVGIILCTLRHYSEEQSMETISLVEQFQGTKVVGFDIAADEAGFPIDNHIKAFEYAHKKGINCTAHAGEACGPESVWETLSSFRPTRIGHGIRSAEDESLLAFLKEKDIHLEVCPTSNVQTNTCKTIFDHPADKIYNSGVSMGINTDARTISNTTLTNEYQILEKIYDWTPGHFLKCNMEAIDHAFASKEIKEKVREQLLSGYRIKVN